MRPKNNDFFHIIFFARMKTWPNTVVVAPSQELGLCFFAWKQAVSPATASFVANAFEKKLLGRWHRGALSQQSEKKRNCRLFTFRQSAALFFISIFYI